VPLIALGDPAGLRRHLTGAGDPMRQPPQGLTVSRALANRLQVKPGDSVQVEALEGSRPIGIMRVEREVEDALGMSAFMPAESLARFLREDQQVSGALLSVDARALDSVQAALDRYPRVSSVSRRTWAAQKFRADTEQVFLTFQLVITVFAAVIAVGVVYNNARIALSVRARDLATMRILGFTRSEISAILIGEQAVQILLGIPLGIPLGKLLGTLLFTATDPELYRMPVVLSPRSVATAAVVIALAGLLSAALVRRRADRLDLIGVLKARD
jgi:putative ABC transport system permease protein